MVADALPAGISDLAIQRSPRGRFGFGGGAPAGLSGRDIHVEGDEYPVALDEVRTSIRRRLLEFTYRPIGWDSYGGRPLEQKVAQAAEQLILDLAASRLPDPILVPTSLGGVALEWHAGDREFSIELRPGEFGDEPTAFAFFSDGAGGEEWERSVSEVDSEELDRAFGRVVHRE